MKTYSFVDGVFRCEVEHRSGTGFLEYDFNTGLFSSSRPSGIPSFAWLNVVHKFALLAQKFVEPLVYD